MSAYTNLIAHIFQARYTPGATEVAFERDEITAAASALGINLPKNLGDVIYTFRFRGNLPPEIADTAPEGKEWIITLAGRGLYKFELASASRVLPNPALLPIKIPDATPQIINRYALGDEQALLAKVRYNRLIDTFLSLTTYSLQNHLRTTVQGVGQIEVDELYVGVNTHGAHYVIPVQAKGGTDQIGVVQTQQDLALCAEKFPHLKARAVSAQFMDNDVIALFELVVVDNEVKALNERHYQLVPADGVTLVDLAMYEG